MRRHILVRTDLFRINDDINHFVWPEERFVQTAHTLQKPKSLFWRLHRELRAPRNSRCWCQAWWGVFFVFFLTRHTGGECFCFAGLPDEDKLVYVRDEQCREPCKGDPTFFCGGTTAVHIYVASKRKIIENIFLCLLTSLSNWVVPIWGQLLPGGRVVWFPTGSWRSLPWTGWTPLHAGVGGRVGLGRLCFQVRETT